MPFILCSCTSSHAGVTKTEDNHWIPLAEQAMKVIFLLSEHPEAMAADIIKRLAKNVIGIKRDGGCPVQVMSRFLGLVGHVALQMLMFLDVHLLTELKRRNNIREGEKKTAEEKKGVEPKVRISDFLPIFTSCSGGLSISKENMA